MYRDEKKIARYQILADGMLNNCNAEYFGIQIITSREDPTLTGAEYFLGDIELFSMLVGMLEDMETFDEPVDGSLALFFDDEGNLVDLGRVESESNGSLNVTIKFRNYIVSVPVGKAVVEATHESVLYIEDPF